MAGRYRRNGEAETLGCLVQLLLLLVAMPFLHNLLLGERNELHNRDLHISVVTKTPKVDIESLLSQKGAGFSVKTVVHVHRLFERFGTEGVFGRGAVVELLALQNSSASKLIAKLVHAGIIEPVAEQGKGKYRFARS